MQKVTVLKQFKLKYWYVLFPAKPTITYDDKFKDTIVVKAGNKIAIEANIAGVPTPTSSWSYKDAALEPSKHIQAETQKTYGRLTVLDAQRPNSGDYKLTAENAVGKAEATFTLVVKGTCFNNVK